MMLRAPSGWTSAWDRATARERTLVALAAFVVVAGVWLGVAWPALERDIARTEAATARERADYAYLAALAQPSPGAAVAPAADARAAVEAALAARGLRPAVTSLELRDGRVSLVLGAVAFDALVAALDALARDSGLRIIEARIAARVEPGMVRAELVLGR